jgi:putative hydrolase of the HAD superfamily
MKALILDYGNVLSLDQRPELYDHAAGAFGVTADQVYAGYWENRLDYDRGWLDGRNYWERVAGLSVPILAVHQQLDQLIHWDAESWSAPNPAVLAIAGQAVDRGLRVGLLSNMPIDIWQELQAICAWMPRFDQVTVSGFIGAIKPEREIYEHCLQGLGVEPGEAVFLDDRPENVEAARALGIDARWFHKDAPPFDWSTIA